MLSMVLHGAEWASAEGGGSGREGVAIVSNG